MALCFFPALSCKRKEIGFWHSQNLVPAVLKSVYVGPEGIWLMTGACQTINTRADGHLEITPAASTRGTQQPQLHPLVRPTSTTCPATSTAFPLELVPTSTPCPTSTTASPAPPAAPPTPRPTQAHSLHPSVATSGRHTGTCATRRPVPLTGATLA